MEVQKYSFIRHWFACLSDIAVCYQIEVGVSNADQDGLTVPWYCSRLLTSAAADHAVMVLVLQGCIQIMQGGAGGGENSVISLCWTDINMLIVVKLLD